MKLTREEVLRKVSEGTKITELSQEEKALLTDEERESGYQGEVAEFVSEAIAQKVDEGFPYDEAKNMVIKQIREMWKEEDE